MCSAKCRVYKSRGGGSVPPPLLVPADGDLVAAVSAELSAAGRLDSALGRQAVRLAQRMGEFDTGGGVAALSRELRSVMAAALQTAVAMDDPVDELRARRDAKRSAG